MRPMEHPADWPADARAALASYDTVVQNLTAGEGLVDTVLKVKFEPKLAALELLAKHLDLLTDRTQVDQAITITWLAPEPLPPLPDVHMRLEEKEPPHAPIRRLEPETDHRIEMGSAPAGPGLSSRTEPSRFLILLGKR